MNCEQKQSQGIQYYPVDSLLNGQIKMLSFTRASVSKVTWLGDKKVVAKLVPGDASWTKELDVFMNMETLNKPINRGSYEVSDDVDKKSNLRIKTFISTKELPIEYVKIFYEGSLSNVRRIESKYKESNVMYKAVRFLYLEFDDIHHKPQLTHYAIQGGQKMFLGDSVQYRIDAAISIP